MIQGAPRAAARAATAPTVSPNRSTAVVSDGSSERDEASVRGVWTVAALRMDGNGTGIFDFSMAKAQAAAAWGFSTAQMLENARGTPGFAEAPHVVIVPGGLPVFAADGKTRLGAVGVSGEAPTDDAACAEAGIKAAGLRSTRS